MRDIVKAFRRPPAARLRDRNGGKRIQLEGHLDAAELFERYRAAADRVERSQLQIIWLLRSGKSLAEVAAASGYATRRIQKLIHRYNAGATAMPARARC